MKKIVLKEDSRKNLLKRFITLGLVIFLVTLFAEIWLVNRLSIYGDKIYQLKQAQAILELENRVLSNSIAMSSSMSVLDKKATQLGFNNIISIEYIKFADKLASVQ